MRGSVSGDTIMCGCPIAHDRLTRQPWVAELVRDDSVALYRSKDRDPPVTDPLGRQLTIGIDAGGPMLETLSLLGIFTREAAPDLNSPGSRDAVESTANVILCAPACTMNITPGNTRKDQLEAGRQWMQLNLKTTSPGMALRPVSQALQEYHEVKPYLDRVHDMFASDGGTVPMPGLLGYGAQPARTPRWPIESRLMHV